MRVVGDAPPRTDALRPRTPAVLERGGAVLGSIAGFALLFELSCHAVASNSDSATVVLEGDAMATGNVLLHGWSLSLDSFWTVDALFYGLGARVLGLRAVLVNVVPAGLAILVVVLGIAIAADGLGRRSATAAGATVGVVLLLPSHALSFFFLQGPWHVGTALFGLGAFYGLRTGRFGAGWVAAVLLLAAGLLGDFQMMAFGVVPVALAGGVAIARTRSWREGTPLLAAAVAGVVLAEAVRELSLAIGTFTFEESHHTASAAQMATNLRHLGSWSAALFGVVPGPFGGAAVPLPVAVLHGVVLAGLVTACALGLWRLVADSLSGRQRRATPTPMTVRAPWRLDDLLVLAVLGDLGVFEILTLSNNVDYARYLTAGVIFATVLLGRTLGKLLARAPRRAVGTTIGATSLVVAVAFAAEIPPELHTPRPAQPAVALEDFLTAHHLHDGIGDYWAASVVTVQSHGAIRVRPVVANLQHRIVPDGRQADESWYRGKRFSFLVYQTLPYGRVDAATVAGTFGTPLHTYAVGSYFVAVWSHPITVSGAPFA